jgi:hypothetical protein
MEDQIKMDECKNQVKISAFNSVEKGDLNAKFELSDLNEMIDKSGMLFRSDEKGGTEQTLKYATTLAMTSASFQNNLKPSRYLGLISLEIDGVNEVYKDQLLHFVKSGITEYENNDNKFSGLYIADIILVDNQKKHETIDSHYTCIVIDTDINSITFFDSAQVLYINYIKLNLLVNLQKIVNSCFKTDRFMKAAVMFPHMKVHSSGVQKASSSCGFWTSWFVLRRIQNYSNVEIDANFLYKSKDERSHVEKILVFISTYLKSAWNKDINSINLSKESDMIETINQLKQLICKSTSNLFSEEYLRTIVHIPEKNVMFYTKTVDKLNKKRQIDQTF